MLYPSTTIRRRDIQRNSKWYSNVNVNCQIVDVSLNISASSGHKRMKLPPFVTAQWGGSNELCEILLWSLDAEIINILILVFFKLNQIRIKSNWIWISSVQFNSVWFSSVQFDSVSNQISFKSDQISSNQFESNQFQIKSVSN